MRFRRIYGFDWPRRMIAEEVTTGDLHWLTINDRTLKPKYWIFECVPLEPNPDSTKKFYVKAEEVEGFEDVANWGVDTRPGVV